VFPLSLVLVVSLAFSIEYSKGQSITDVSKFSTQTEIGTEEEPTIEDDTEEEETIQDDEPEPTDEEDNDTVTTVPLKRPTGTDLELKNLTTAPLEEPGKLIFSSCQKDYPKPMYASNINPISCNVPGASPGDNVVVSSTQLDYMDCISIASSKVSKPNVVSILLLEEYLDSGFTEGHKHTASCAWTGVRGTVIFSIIVFRPTEQGILRPLEELPDLGSDK
jgi:hypothetical protein